MKAGIWIVDIDNEISITKYVPSVIFEYVYKFLLTDYKQSLMLRFCNKIQYSTPPPPRKSKFLKNFGLDTSVEVNTH